MRFNRLLLTLVLLAGCASAGEVRFTAAVPARAERLSFDVNAPAGAAAQIADAAACLVRTGKPVPDCEQQNLPVCDTRTQAQVSASLRPAFEKLAELHLSSALSFDADVRRLIAGAEPTTAVADARREDPCWQWTMTGGAAAKCGAFRYGPIWVLLTRSAATPGPAERVEVFLADLPCRQEIRTDA